jgi:hypothetical protein
MLLWQGLSGQRAATNMAAGRLGRRGRLDEIGTNLSMIGQNDRGRAEMRVIPKAVGGHHYPKCNNHLADIWQTHDSLLNSHFK